MSEEDAILEYGMAIGSAWEKFLKGVQNGDFIYTNEQEIRCYLFAECLKYLQEKEFPKPYGVFVDYKANNRLIDLAFPIDKEKVFAVEIKYDPDPSGVEDDLTKLRELIDKNIAVRGVFMTLAKSDYRLKERLNEQGIFSKFGLKEEGEGSFGFIEWHTFQGKYIPQLIDALYIILWKR